MSLSLHCHRRLLLIFNYLLGILSFLFLLRRVLIVQDTTRRRLPEYPRLQLVNLMIDIPPLRLAFLPLLFRLAAIAHTSFVFTEGATVLGCGLLLLRSWH